MSCADQLLELMFSWMEQRENCAEKLEKLADELETIRENCNAAEVVGSTTAAVGSLSLIGAGLATFFTFGAAAPLLAVGAVLSGAGFAVSVGTMITEGFLSSSTMKEAEAIEKKSNDIGGEIQKQFELLREEVSRMYCCSDPDEVNRHVLTAFMAAVGRKEGLQVDPRALDYMTQAYFTAGPESTSLESNINPVVSAGLTGAAGIFNFFALKVAGKTCKRLITKGTKQLTKKMLSAGLKIVAKGGARVVGGAVGLAFALPEAINTWTNLIKKNHVTEASRSLRDTAKDIRRTCRTLREEIDEIRKPVEQLVKIKHIIENSDRSSEEKSQLIQYVIDRCPDEAVKQWLQEDFGALAFCELVDMCDFLRQKLDEEVEKGKIDREDIDIIFVAHGDLESSMISASCLLPLPSIKDVVLYSPWNCSINGDAAYGIAKGCIQPQYREFVCRGQGCQTPSEGHQPRNLPNRWNSLRAAGELEIPNIMVRPLSDTDGPWKRFLLVQEIYGEPGRNRVIIPFFLPGDEVVPFWAVTLALSKVLPLYGYQATVHLAACLSRSAGTSLNMDYLQQQYCCTVDKTRMTVSEEMFRNIDTEADAELYRSFKALFG